MTTIRVGMAQVNPTVGDLDGNAELIKSFMSKAEDLGLDLLAFPEMVITGYRRVAGYAGKKGIVTQRKESRGIQRKGKQSRAGAASRGTEKARRQPT